METDKTFFDFLCKAEGCKTQTYNDSNGYPTIGIGHLLTDAEKSSNVININGEQVHYKNGLTLEQCQNLNKQDVAFAVNCVNALVKVPLTQNQFNALVDFTFNVGAHAFKTSTLLTVLNQRKYNDVPTQMLRWTHANGEVNQGLLNRRNAEIVLWKS